MTQPLALVLYQKLLPGSQLVNRLQDLNFRVQTLAEPGRLVPCAEQAKPILVLADLDSTGPELLAAITGLKQNPATKHLPIIGFGAGNDPERQAQLQQAGVTLIVSEAAILNHLRQILDQALRVE